MMSHRLGRELQHPLTAIAPVVSAVFGDEPPASHPVSALMINGLLDKSVPPDGGTTGGRAGDAWDGTPMLPQPAQAAYWARVNGCAIEPRKETRGAVVHWRYDCPSGRAVEWYQLSDMGHAWPGGERGSKLGDAPSMSMDATTVIWDFFKGQAR
jgi:polyhydroxybutyrate depolymerase